MSSSASHRAHESRRYMSENGYYTTTAPYGYSNSGHFSLNIVPHEAEVVKQIFDWKTEEHFSYELIVDKLNAKGIRTKNNHYWSTSSIEYILHNPVYMGKIRYGKMIYQGIHTQVVCMLTSNSPSTRVVCLLTSNSPGTRMVCMLTTNLLRTMVVCMLTT